VRPLFAGGLVASAFGFAPSGQAARDAARRAQGQAILGFYDARAKKLYFRSVRGDGRRIVPAQRGDLFVLTHEIEHALQDENFGLLCGRKAGNDETLAYHAWPTSTTGAACGRTRWISPFFRPAPGKRPTTIPPPAPGCGRPGTSSGPETTG
jgi:hypothetical protein